MTEKQFTIESERINNTYSIHIRKEGEVIFEVSNWNSLSSMHKKECEEFVDYLNTVTEENEKLKQREETLLHEIEDFQDILASKEQIFLKHVNTLIDDLITKVPPRDRATLTPTPDTISQGIYNQGYLCALNDLKKELSL